MTKPFGAQPVRRPEASAPAPTAPSTPTALSRPRRDFAAPAATVRAQLRQTRPSATVQLRRRPRRCSDRPSADRPSFGGTPRPFRPLRQFRPPRRQACRASAPRSLSLRPQVRRHLRQVRRWQQALPQARPRQEASAANPPAPQRLHSPSSASVLRAKSDAMPPPARHSASSPSSPSTAPRRRQEHARRAPRAPVRLPEPRNRRHVPCAGLQGHRATISISTTRPRCWTSAAAPRILLEPTRDGNRVLLDGIDVSRRIRDADVTAAASRASVHPAVRAWMVAQQRALGAGRRRRHGRPRHRHGRLPRCRSEDLPRCRARGARQPPLPPGRLERA